MALSERRRRRATRNLHLAATLVLAACSSRYIDLIEREDAAAGADAGTDASAGTGMVGTDADVAATAGAGGDTQQVDPCASLSADRCAADTADKCKLQPNRTGCLSTDSSCGAGTCSGGDPFVRRSGEALVLHNAPYTFVGAVSWGIAWADHTCNLSGAYQDQATAIAKTFDELATMRVSVLRFWAFQLYAGSNGTDFSHFDRVVDAARSHGVRLLPVLENMRNECSSGQQIDDTWFAGGYKSPYGTYARSYRDYVTSLVEHFSNEPTIMGWELMHEASGNQFSALDGFIADMTTLIHGADGNHLISVGLDDGSTMATSTNGNPSNYFQLQKHDYVDLVDIQDFSAPNDPYPASVAADRMLTHALGLVAFSGSSAVLLTEISNAAINTRASQISAKMDAAIAHDFRGFLVYDYAPKWLTASYDFDSRPEDPLAGPTGVIAKHAQNY